MKEINYQFVAVPLNLFYCLDNNLRSMLFTLIQMSTYRENEAIEKGKKWDGWFLAANRILADNSNLSENLVRVTLDTLYQNGIISIQSEGKGKGQNTPPNKIKVNWERFKDFEKESIDDCIQDPRLAIETLEYKGSNYHPSYLKQDKTVVTETVMLEDGVNDAAGDLVTNLVKSEDNIYNIYNKNNKENKDNIYNIESKNSLEKNNKSNNTNISYIDSSFEGKEESIWEYELNNMIKGLSKAKDVDSIRSQFMEIVRRINHSSGENKQKYTEKLASTINNRCSELGISFSNIQV